MKQFDHHVISASACHFQMIRIVGTYDTYIYLCYTTRTSDTQRMQLPLLASASFFTTNPMIITVIGLNAALQKRLVIPNGSLIPGNVHRVSSVEYGIGGKGQDVAVTLSCLQRGIVEAEEAHDPEDRYPFQIRLAQFLGMDPAGDQVCAMMQQQQLLPLALEQSSSLTVRVQSPLRVCTSIVTEDSTTELVEPSGNIQPGEIQALMNKLRNPSSSTAKALCIMGSLPPGCSETSTYADMYQRIANDEALTVVDSIVAGIFELPLRSPTIFKINASELCRLTNVQPPKITTASETDGVSTETVVSAIQAFLQKCSHPHHNMDLRHIVGVAVTDGAHAATLAVRRNDDDETSSSSSEYTVYQFQIPQLNTISSSSSSSLSSGSEQKQKQRLYPIGAGDAVAAGLLASWLTLSFPEDIKEQCHSSQSFIKALQVYMEKIEQDTVHSSTTTPILVTAFAFALCCGSASCLQSQNSVVEMKQVLELFSRHPTPTHLHENTIILL